MAYLATFVYSEGGEVYRRLTVRDLEVSLTCIFGQRGFFVLQE